MNDYLFYDIEVFTYDALVVFKDHEKKVVKIFHNDFRGLAQLIKGKTLVGFNNYWYDDKILTYMIEKKSQHVIKELNDKIITGKNTGYINKACFESLDVFQQIDVSKPSLKKIEGNMGRMILESSVPFTIDRPLKEHEYKDVLNYCAYDVDTTIDIFKERNKSYFLPKQSLLDMLDNPKAKKWNTTTISANLLLEKPLNRWAWAKIPADMWQLVPEEVQIMWREKSESYKNESSKKHIDIENFDCNIQFGFGGLHGAHKTIKKSKSVKLLDVTSMYPTIILLLNCLGNASEKYKRILEARIKAKRNKEDILADALKLILNSVYGNLNNRFSLLYNPKALLSVCMYGQIALYELCKRLHPFCTILNINTDGVAFIPNENENRWIDAYKSWETDFSLQLEEKNFDLFFQKDVNNYIAVKGDKIICKGGDVNRYEKDAFFKNNNMRILDIALVNKLVYGINVDETFENNLDKPHLFQIILKVGNTFQGTFCEEGKEYNKVNRVFAAKKSGFCLFKKRADNQLVKFADAPENMFLWNDDCNKLENFEDMIDLNHYYNIVEKRLKRWV